MTYLGLELNSPFIASSSPLTGDPDRWRELEDCGAGALVLPSIFEEQLRQEEAFVGEFLHSGMDALSEAHSFFPEAELYDQVSVRSLARLRQAREALDIPVIASLNGISAEGWCSFAKELEAAGASAIELNLYEVAADPSLSSQQLETQQLEALARVLDSVQVPVSVKLSPYYSALAHMAATFVERGASGLVLFNRFYQPDFEIQTRSTSLKLGLSRSRDLLLPLSWIAILRGQLETSLACSGGVHEVEDALKAFLAGADVCMLASALLRHGPGRIRELQQGLTQWMETQGYQELDELRGSMQRQYNDRPELFERANYIRLLETYPTGD